MAVENATVFVKKLLEDEALRNRIASVSTEEGLKIAKEMGLDFTGEELREASEAYEMTPEELEMVSGGDSDSGDTVRGMVAGAGSGATAGCLIGFIGGPLGAAIGTCIGGAIGMVTGGLIGGNK